LVDDYRGRSHYREIERFGTLESYQGRMGVFRPKVVDSAALREALSRFGLDWR
jgi:hypothetical protein